VAYILSPGDSSVDLLSINLASTLRASSPNLDKLTTGLPFLTDPGSTSFTASISENGIITILAGECSSPGSASIWTYDPVSSKAEWTKHETDADGLRAPSFLGGSLSFSATIAPVVSPPITYVYGGMCPWSNASDSTWQSSASYSNQMLKATSQQSESDAAYTLEYAANNGPPIAVAGFTFTTLAPSIANRSGTVTQQANHVLLGGHTQGAFINMSTAGLWSLPEESWGFISINPPSAKANTELAVKDLPTSVDSRSGHSAVLNEDGSALVILGGWVGDLTQKATPQLAILEMGNGFDEWQWSIPDVQPSGPGIYGHGAALLPGNVMMVYGGYSISSSSSSKAKKRQVGGSGEVPMFLNLTSMTWANDYTNPASSEVGSGDAAALANDGNSKSKKIGLGVGLGLGIPLLIAAILFAVWYRRHARHERDFRDEVVRNLSQDAARFMQRNTDNDEMLEREHDSDVFPWNAASAREWYTGGHDPYVRGQRSIGYESLRGTPRSSLSSFPPPPPATANSGTGRLRAARGLYQPTTVLTSGGGTYDFGGPLRTPGGIGPIYEEADEDGVEEAEKKKREEDSREVVIIGGPGDRASPSSPVEPDDSSTSDPFLTPANATPRGSGLFAPPSRAGSTPSPDGGDARAYACALPQDPEVRDWVSDVDAADAVLAARIGPHGTTTTMATTLVGGGGDEARTASNLSESNRSTFSQHQAMSRSGSVRSHFRGGSNATAAVAAAAAAEARLGSSSGSSSHTWGTAKSNLAGLRDEGPGLLLGAAAAAELEDEDEDQASVPGSPSKYKQRRSWLGSLRRVFSGGSGSTSGSSRADSPTHDSLMEGSGSDYEPRLVGLGPGGQLLRRKQGREAWEGEDGGVEDDWDVERAVEQRLVQIMFTVPKERLRVVNAEIEKEEEVLVVDPEQDAGYEREEKLGEVREKLVEYGEEQAKANLLDHEGRAAHREHDGQLLELPATKAESISSSMSIHMAEAVKLERPRTKVLEMVESIESLSARGSPAGSPQR